MSRGPSTRTRQRSTPGEATAGGEAVAAPDAASPVDIVRDGFVLDFISGTVILNGRRITRRLRRKKRIVDDDLPEIAKRYHALRREHPEPRA